MRSITAASSRKAEAQTIYGGGKRTLDGMEGPDQKRALLDHFLQQKAAASFMNPNHHNSPMYANLAAPGGAVSLTSALRPSLGLGGMAHTHSHHHQGHFTQGLPAMMSKHMDIMGQQPQPHNNLINNYMPQGAITNSQVQQSYTNANSTADIVNAAISALRYAS